MDFEEYIRQGEPSRAERAQAWRTAIGLQDVDGLKQQGKTPAVMNVPKRPTQSLTESPNFSQNRHSP